MAEWDVMQHPCLRGLKVELIVARMQDVSGYISFDSLMRDDKSWFYAHSDLRDVSNLSSSCMHAVSQVCIEGA